MAPPVKIGIVLNYKAAEKKKDELLCVKSSTWLKDVNDKYTIMRKNKKCVPADVAIGLYILHKYPDSTIDFISPEEISTKRFKKNDINFIVIYDLLESFHLSDKSNFIKFKTALKNSNNVYPPYDYQKFVNNKCIYYKYLAKKGIPVAPTQCITKQKWFARDPEKYVTNLLSKVKRNKWESIITKPVYGQESKDFAKFIACDRSLECQKKKMISYLSKNIPKYKSIVVQEYIAGFDKEKPEIRTYFINGKYMYSIVTTSTKVSAPKQEGGKYNIPDENWNYILKLAQKVMDSLPKLDLKSGSSSILTRIDIGSGLGSAKYGYFINEIEFVPSLYIEDQSFPVVEKIGESLHAVAEEYLERKSSLPIKTIF